AYRLELKRTRQPDDVALTRAGRRRARRSVRRGEDAVPVDVRAALVVVVGSALEHYPHLAGVLLEDVGPGADQPLLEIAVLLQDLARENDGDEFGHVLRKEGVGRLQMDTQRVLLGCLHPLDFLERERLHPLLRVGLEAILDVRRGELAPVERRDVLPFDALPELERPHPVRRVALPRLREVAPEGHVARTAGFVGEPVTDETVAREPDELVEADRLRQPRIDHRRIPGRGAGENSAPFRRLGAGRNPVGIGRPRLGPGAATGDTRGQRGSSGTGYPGALEELPSGHAPTSRATRTGCRHRSLLLSGGNGPANMQPVKGT